MEMQHKRIPSKLVWLQMEDKLHTSAKLTDIKTLRQSIHESAEQLSGCATSDVHLLDISKQHHEFLSGVAEAKTVLTGRLSKTG